MQKTLFIAATLSLGFVIAPAMGGDMNQPQDHRSTINQQQHNQVGQPIDNRIDSEVKQNQSNTPVNPPTTRPLPVTPPSRSLMTPEPPTATDAGESTNSAENRPCPAGRILFG